MDNKKLNGTELKEVELEEVAGGKGEPNYKVGDFVITNKGWELEIIAYSGWDRCYDCQVYKTIVRALPDGAALKVGETYFVPEVNISRKK